MGELDSQHLGHYRLIRHLGRGGTAEVYLGEHIFLKTQAAIKVLQAPLSEHEVPAILHEARLIAGLVHPHIVRVLDFGVQDGLFYLVMEYAARGTLRQHCPPGTRLSPATVARLVKQIAAALQYAHDHQVIHCDVKPENILLGADGRVLLSDFGISLVLQTVSVQIQQIAGTIAYMAPEQFSGKPRQASDQYSLAVIAYECLSGERPFQGNLAAISGQHLYSPHPSLREKFPHMAPAIDEVLHKALEKDPARRFPSISEFAGALEQACPAPSAEDTIGPVTLTPLPVPRPAFTRAEETSEVTRTDNEVSLAQVNIPDKSQLLQPTMATGSQKQPVPSSSRRTFLIGLGGGVAILGVAGALFALAAGKLATLFTPGSASSASMAAPAPHPDPGRTAQPTPTQSLSPSNIPLGTTLTSYTGQSSDVTGVCWSPSPASRTVASCCLQGNISIWNALTGATLLTIRQSGALNTLAWSPDGRLLAAAGEAGVVEIWEAASGNLAATCTGHTRAIHGLAWSPDSRRLVSAGEDARAIVWDAATGNQLSVYTGHSDFVWTAAWAPNGSAIATGSWDTTVQIWHPTRATLILRYTATQPVRTVAWSPNSGMLASGGDDDSVQVWQASNGNILAVYRGHTDHIEAAQWSPDGRYIASASKDTTAQIWQATNASHFYTYTGHNQLVWALAWSPDGQFIATGSQDQTARVWQAR